MSRDATPVSVADQRLVLSDGRSQFFNRLNTEWLAVSEAVILVSCSLVCSSVCLSVCLFVCLFVYLSVCLFVCLLVCLSV